MHKPPARITALLCNEIVLPQPHLLNAGKDIARNPGERLSGLRGIILAGSLLYGSTA